ncbi:hypothetical protein [Acidovorax sp. PRC11]|nr:hypothetical protein [Acidovorax sp. PRC11]MDT0139101.1 hypothetical protein [Acidovorax sp. PRC11]
MRSFSRNVAAKHCSVVIVKDGIQSVPDEEQCLPGSADEASKIESLIGR